MIELDPNNADAYFLRGTIKILMKNSSACYDFRKAKELGSLGVDEEIEKYCK